MDVGVNESSKRKLVRSTWAGHVKKGDKKLAKRADAQMVEGNGSEEDRNCDEGLH